MTKQNAKDAEFLVIVRGCVLSVSQRWKMGPFEKFIWNCRCCSFHSFAPISPDTFLHCSDENFCLAEVRLSCLSCQDNLDLIGVLDVSVLVSAVKTPGVNSVFTNVDLQEAVFP